MRQRYIINIDATLRAKELVDGNGSIEVDDIPGLDEAVLLINKVCNNELLRRKKQETEHLFLEVAAQIKNGSNHKDVFETFNRYFELKKGE